MLYPWLEWQRSLLTTWVELSRHSVPIAPLDRLLHPPRELIARTLAAGATHPRALAETVRADAGFPIRVEPLATLPFARLLRITGPRGSRRRFLLLAPHSGYATVVISPLVTVLAALGEVLVTEWLDARLVPTAEGGFGLAQQVEVGEVAALAMDEPAHLVALSQSGPAALLLVARLAEHAPRLLPASLAFLGCQVDPARSSSPIQRALAAWPRDLLATQLTTRVGYGYPGVGRRVYPSLLQLLAYGFCSPQVYAEVQHGLWRELAAGSAGIYSRQHTDLHSLADVPAELFLDMVDWILAPDPWAWPELRPSLAARHLPALTVESAEDELVGRGQTHGLRRQLKLSQAKTVTLRRGRHHDLFTGPRFLMELAPLLARFYAALDR